MKEALLPISDASPQGISPCSGRRRVRCLVRCTALGALVLLGLAMMHHCGGGNDGGEPVLNRLQDLLGGRNGGSGSDTCEVYLGRHKVERFSVILTADPGDFSGVSEAHHIIRNLQKRKLKPRDETVCAEHYRGTLMGQDVLVVTTGIGPTAAGLCTLEIVLACGDYIDQLIYFGTSGWSPQYGGVLNPPNCTAANDNARISRMGDICISPFTVNWSCKKTTWDMQATGFPNQCVRPREFAGPNATILYGECVFVEDNRRANLALSRDLAAATRTALGAKNFPQRNSLVLEHEGLYWQYMAEGTKQTYPNIDNTELPYIWDHTQCVEVDAQFFYSGVPFELAARDYAAATINAALRLKGAEAKSASDVIAVSAMEGIGVSEAMERYHGLHTTENFIPYTNVRTISNWLHQPVHQTQPGVWDIYKQVEEDYVNGYAYAIASGSSVIMTYFQQACLEDYGLLESTIQEQQQQGEAAEATAALQSGGGKRHSGLPAECTFQIDYDETVRLLTQSGWRGGRGRR